MKTKTLDCVEMKRRGAAQVYNKVSKLSLSQQLKFWKKSVRRKTE